MKEKRQTAASALQAAARCVDVCVKAVVAQPNAFVNAWELSRRALNEETASSKSRELIRQIVLSVLLTRRKFAKPR